MRFYVGSYTRLGGPGVGLCEVEGEALKVLETAAEVENPSYVILSRDQKTLYTTSESDEGGAVAAFDVSGGHLRFAGKQDGAGKSACHLALSPDERFLYVASYMSGSLEVFPVNGSEISPRIQMIGHEGHGPNPARQERAHTHFVAFDPQDETLLYAVDLGIDAVMIYRQDAATGLLSALERVDVPAGCGPRHLAFHGDMMYVAHELGNAVSAFHRAPEGWRLVQTLSTLPEDWRGESSVAAIRVHGGRVFVSNRGHDSLAIYSIRLGGVLSLEGICSTMGKNPRDFALLPDGRILAAHQDTGDIRLLTLPDANPFGKTHLAEYTRSATWLPPEGAGLMQLGGALPFPGAVCVCPAEG